MNFSDTLLLVMKRTGFTKPQLARATGYSQQHIADLFKGKRRWNEDSLSKVCSALDISIQIAPLQADQPLQPSVVEDKCSKLIEENKHLRNQVGHLKDAVKSLSEALDYWGDLQ